MLALIVGVIVRGGGAGVAGDVVAGSIGLSMAVLFWRAAGAVLLADENGVTVRAVFRTVRIPWSGIAAFEIGRYKLLGCVRLVRQNDGVVVPVFAVQGITGQPRRKTSVAAHTAADELNAMLAP